MRSNIKRFLMVFGILLVLPTAIKAEDKRSLPLDVYLIIDGSQSMENSKNEALAWINGEFVDKILMEGDQISIWTAGNNAEIIYSGSISSSGGSAELKEKISNFSITGEKADFSGALRDAASRSERTPKNRLSYTIVVTASAQTLGGSFLGASPSLFRWFKSEKYERWQVLIVDPNIGPKVREAAQSYMSSL